MHIRKCAYCENFYDTKIMEYDHFIPRSRGGSNSFNNKYLCCCYCNSAKQDRLFKTLEDAKTYLKSRSSSWEDRAIKNIETLKA